MKYYLQREGRTYGPYSFDDLKRYQAENRIGPNDLVRREDSQQWDPWQQVLSAPAPQPPSMPPVTPPSAPASSGFSNPPSSFAAGGDSPFSKPAATPSPDPSFGGPQPGGFGGSQPQAGFVAPPSGGGFGQPPQSGFGDAPSAGFGGPSGSSFGAPPAQGGFGGGGFGQPPAYGGGFGAPAAGFGGPGPGGFGGQAVGPMPPDMQWWLVLIIGLLCGLFTIFWVYKQVTFVKQIDPSNTSGKKYLLGLGLYLGGFCLAMIAALFATGRMSELSMIGLFAPLLYLGGFVFIVLAAFEMRRSIHNYYTTVEPMGINLMDTTGAVMTFFFSVYYFQYHFANIAARKKAMGHQ